MSGSRYVTPQQFAVDAAGIPYAGGQLFFYETGTTTPQNTYSDPALTIPNPNPIIADAAGQFGSIFLLSSPNYRVVLEDANNVQIWTFDPVGPGAGSSSGGGAVPIGGQIPYGGTTAPSGWLLCDGAAVSRTSFSALFTVINTAYGAGDGSTTFNVPDKRGRTSVGKDDMGGSAANRITSGVCGISGTTLGAAGGDQNAQTHTHALTDPGHTHPLTDPGHFHAEKVPQGSGSVSAWFLQLTGTPTVIGGLDTDTATTGITISSNTTGITIANAFSGGAQNVQPSQIDNWIIRAS